MRILGLLAFVGLVVWSMDVAAGLAAFLDVPALAVVFGGGLAFAVAKGGFDQSRNQVLLNFAEGAVYLGWLGFLAGCIGIGASLTDLNTLGPAAAIALLTVFYGYAAKWTAMAVIGQNES